jgi:mRNA interferase RelE/StbE
MSYRLVLTRIAQKQLDRLQSKDRIRVMTSLEKLKENPWAGKLLDLEYKGYRSLRVWPLRIIYAVDHSIITVTVLKIGHRKEVYR